MLEVLFVLASLNGLPPGNERFAEGIEVPSTILVARASAKELNAQLSKVDSRAIETAQALVTIANAAANLDSLPVADRQIITQFTRDFMVVVEADLSLQQKRLENTLKTKSQQPVSQQDWKELRSRIANLQKRLINSTRSMKAMESLSPPEKNPYTELVISIDMIQQRLVDLADQFFKETKNRRG